MINAILSTHEKGNMGKVGLEFRAIAPGPHLNLLILKVSLILSLVMEGT